MKLKMIRSPCLAIVGLVSVFALGTGSASAVGLLFKPESGVFPYHATGLLVAHGTLPAGGRLLLSSAMHTLLLVLTSTLFDAHLLFLGVNADSFGSEHCNSTGLANGNVLLSLEGHLGLADESNGTARHAALLLIPPNYSFVCEGAGGLVKETVSISGNLVGEINKPAAGVASEELGVSFKPLAGQTGKQLFTTFLFTGGGSQRVLFLSKLGGGGAQEEAAIEEPEAVFKALPGLGAFLLILD